MGAVHGVYLKYVGLSAVSYAGLLLLMKDENGANLTFSDVISSASYQAVMRSTSAVDNREEISPIRLATIVVLGYSVLLNGLISILFKMEWGMGIIGKNRKTGQIPIWSYLLYFPFHVPTIIYTYVHTLIGTHKVKKDGKEVRETVPAASEVQPGWWVGGCHGHELNKDWACVVDLTVEFPETTIKRTKVYLSIPTWDGVPASPEQLDEAATVAVTASKEGGDVLVHCAHGRGRSTTVMCVCLVKAGLFATWEEAFEKGIRPQRPVCKLNRRMRQALTEWQTQYATAKKSK